MLFLGIPAFFLAVIWHKLANIVQALVTRLIFGEKSRKIIESFERNGGTSYNEEGAADVREEEEEDEDSDRMAAGLHTRGPQVDSEESGDSLEGGEEDFIDSDSDEDREEGSRIFVEEL